MDPNNTAEPLPDNLIPLLPAPVSLVPANPVLEPHRDSIQSDEIFGQQPAATEPSPESTALPQESLDELFGGRPAANLHDDLFDDRTYTPVLEAELATQGAVQEPPLPPPVAPASPHAETLALASAGPSATIMVDPSTVPINEYSNDDAPAGEPFEYNPDLPAIERLLHGLVHSGGSDMHLVVGEVPRYRINGDLMPVESEPVFTAEAINEILSECTPPERWTAFLETNEMDFAYAMDTAKGSPLTSRFRVNLFVAMEEPGAVFRVIPQAIKSLDDLGVPAIIKTLARIPRGLIWITGPTGSGKSTTGAALLDLMNETRADRIFTIEDPVEFTHVSKRCLISHREVGQDTDSFAGALRAVRREDPDIIYIGEVRDLATMEAAIEAADTGHLVIATLHTSSAPETILRIINSFPEGKQDQIRTTLASNIRAIICQTLVKSGPKGRVPACEIMMVTDAIRNNIRKNDIQSIFNAMIDTSNGSMLLDVHLAQLIGDGLITKKEALKKASSPDALERQLGSGRSGSII